jgi:transmembrane sensor
MDFEHALKYLTNSATESEKLAFEKWIDFSVQNRQEYERFLAAWEAKTHEITGFEPDWQQACEKIILRQQTSINKKTVKVIKLSFNKWRAVAACFLLIASTLLVVYKSGKNLNRESYVKYVTTDSIKSITLPDGTVAWLNRYSELKVPDWQDKDERRVYFSGEAFFEVTPNKHKPFIVQTSNTTTQVLGTSFNMKASETIDQVALVTGKVKFFTNGMGGDSVYLTPGEMVSYNVTKKQIEKTQFANKNFMAWKTKVLEFNNTPISEAINSIANSYNVTISGDINKVSTYTLSANFNNQKIDKVIPVLELTWDAKMVLRNDSLYITFN